MAENQPQNSGQNGNGATPINLAAAPAAMPVAPVTPAIPVAVPAAAPPAASVPPANSSAATTGFKLNAYGISNEQQKASLLEKLLNKAAPTAPTGPTAVPVPSNGAPPANGATNSAANGAANGNPPTNGNGKSNDNAFTKLFGKGATLSGTAPVAKVGSNPLASLLGPKPMFSKGAFEESEKGRKKIAKALFYLAVFIVVGVYGFFYTQLNPQFTLLDSQFGPSTAARFENSNTELQTIQTKLNIAKYRTARLLLADVNMKIDPFQSALATLTSPTAADADKQTAQSSIPGFEKDIKQQLSQVQAIFNQPLGIDTFSKEPITPEQREKTYEGLLKTELTQQRNAAKDEEVHFIDTIIRFVDNKKFRALIRNQDFGKISTKELSALLDQIRQQGIDEFSTIFKVRSARLSWGDVIENIHAAAKKADLYYGQGLFKTVGGFLFSSYRFDAKSSRISISGVTKTSDNKTFSFISKLVDSIEKSPNFKDIDFRSFTKTREENGDYSSSINLEFSIQKGDDPRDDITQ